MSSRWYRDVLSGCVTVCAFVTANQDRASVANATGLASGFPELLTKRSANPGMVSIV